jgi:hypothetical protein
MVVDASESDESGDFDLAALQQALRQIKKPRSPKEKKLTTPSGAEATKREGTSSRRAVADQEQEGNSSSANIMCCNCETQGHSFKAVLSRATVIFASTVGKRTRQSIDALDANHREMPEKRVNRGVAVF